MPIEDVVDVPGAARGGDFVLVQGLAVDFPPYGLVLENLELAVVALEQQERGPVLSHLVGDGPFVGAVTCARARLRGRTRAHRGRRASARWRPRAGQRAG